MSYRCRTNLVNPEVEVRERCKWNQTRNEEPRHVGIPQDVVVVQSERSRRHLRVGYVSLEKARRKTVKVDGNASGINTR